MNKVVLFSILSIVLLGCLNQLVLSFRSLTNNNDEVYDLLNLMNFPQIVSNIFYIIVFLCSLFIFFYK